MVGRPADVSDGSTDADVRPRAIGAGVGREAGTTYRGHRSLASAVAVHRGQPLESSEGANPYYCVLVGGTRVSCFNSVWNMCWGLKVGVFKKTFHPEAGGNQSRIFK